MPAYLTPYYTTDNKQSSSDARGISHPWDARTNLLSSLRQTYHLQVDSIGYRCNVDINLDI